MRTLIYLRTILRGAIAASVLATLASAPASAVPTIYFGENLAPGGTVSGDPVTARTSFESALTGIGNENFEGFSAGTPPLDAFGRITNPSFGITFPGNPAGITATIGDTDSNSGIYTALNGRFATSGTQFYEVSGTFDIVFSNPVSAFGFYGTDISDFDGQVPIVLTKSGGGTVELMIANTPNSNNGSLIFWGFIDTTDTYVGLTIGNTGAGTDFFAFDDMTIGNPRRIIIEAPEPGTLAVFGLGLAGLVFLRRRRAA